MKSIKSMSQARTACKCVHQGAECTLDGEPAKVTGWLEPFATISIINRPWIRAEYSWFAVQRTLASDKKAFSTH